MRKLVLFFEIHNNNNRGGRKETFKKIFNLILNRHFFDYFLKGEGVQHLTPPSPSNPTFPLIELQ